MYYDDYAVDWCHDIYNDPDNNQLYDNIDYDDYDVDWHHYIYNSPHNNHGNHSPEEKSSIWKYFRNFGLICVGFDCFYCVKENDSATIWTIACRCLSGIAIIYICWGCGTVIYTIIKWSAVKLYKLCAFICSWLSRVVIFFIYIGCAVAICTVIKWSVFQLYNSITFICKALVNTPVKMVSSWPPLVKGTIILFSIGCVGWGFQKIFRSVIG